jgi:GNAT superfamily N-acetyltransferase
VATVSTSRESLHQQCPKFIFADQNVNGYVAAYQLDDTHFRLNLIVAPSHTRKGIGSRLLKRIEQEVIREQGKYLQARVFETCLEV